jgi:hypothetical protein
VTFTNSTISGNKAGNNGGGLNNNRGVLNLSHVTLANNTADSDGDDNGDGGGIYSGSGSVALINTILAGNGDDSSVSADVHPDVSGDVTGDAYNLIGDTTGGTGTAGAGSDIVAPTPGLGPQAKNGGRTQTHALLFGSSAIDAVPTASCSLITDQRGEPRPVDGDLDDTANCDIGAYELTPTLIYLPLVMRNH